MPASEARIMELRTELAAVRAAIAETYSASAVGDDNRSLTRQRLDFLLQREASLSWSLGEAIDDKVVRSIGVTYGPV